RKDSRTLYNASVKVQHSQTPRQKEARGYEPFVPTSYYSQRTAVRGLLLASAVEQLRDGGVFGQGEVQTVTYGKIGAGGDPIGQVWRTFEDVAFPRLQEKRQANLIRVRNASRQKLRDKRATQAGQIELVQ